MNQELYRI